MKSSPSIWRYVVNVKLTVKILSIFMAFLESMNFMYLLCQVKNVFFSTWFHVGILLQDIQKNLWCFHVKWYYLTMKYTSHVVRPLCKRSEQEPNNSLNNQDCNSLYTVWIMNLKNLLLKKKKVIKSIEIHLHYR